MTSSDQRPQTLIAAVAFGVIAISPFTILPLLVGALVSDIGFTLKQAGYVAAAEMTGSGLAAFITSMFVARLNRRLAAFASLGLFIVSNLVAARVGELELLMLTRFIAGVGSGTTVAIVSAIFAGTKLPERSFSMLFMGNLVFGMVMFLALPSLILSVWGLSGVYVLLALLAIGVLILLPWLPRSAVGTEPDDKPARLSINFIAGLALSGMLIYFVGIGALWPFVEQLGVIRQLAHNSIGAVLSSAQVGGICGALLAAGITTRFGHRKPIIAGIMLSLFAMAMFIFYTDLWFYAVACVLFYFSFIFTLAYLVGILSALDPLGRLAALGVTMQTAGLALGPALAGEMFVRNGQGGLVGFAAICLLVSFFTMMGAAQGMYQHKAVS